jgi:hypothetical protein
MAEIYEGGRIEGVREDYEDLKAILANVVEIIETAELGMGQAEDYFERTHDADRLYHAQRRVYKVLYDRLYEKLPLLRSYVA